MVAQMLIFCLLVYISLLYVISNLAGKSNNTINVKLRFININSISDNIILMGEKIKILNNLTKENSISFTSLVIRDNKSPLRLFEKKETGKMITFS